MDEPNALMRWVMFHFAGGDALWGALCSLAVISVVPERSSSAWRWTALVSLMVVWGGLTSPAWSVYLLLVAASVISVWRVIIHRHGYGTQPALRAGMMVRGLCLVLALWEWSATWNFQAVESPQSLCVIADSITAGLNDGEETWPKRLAAQTGIIVKDASQPGATLKSALQQAKRLDDDHSPLVLEIGGNDLLSGLPRSDFEAHLETLCQKVCSPGRVVWMCELPLPPFSSAYGETQRRICRRFEIRMIPKRRLMHLLTTSGATVDSIHLSPHGQELFCRMMLQATGIEIRGEKMPIAYEKREPARRQPAD